MKKTFSLMMAMIMVIALALPVFASEDEYEVEATGITAAPTIKVTMPKGMSVVLNPYKMSYTNQTLSISANQSTFISPAVSIKNESNVALKMEVKGAAVPADNLKVVSASNNVQTSTPGDKNVYIQLNVEVDKTADVQASTTVATTTNKALSSSDGTLFGVSGTTDTRLALAAVASGATYVWLQFSGDVNSNPKEAYTAEDTLDATLTFTFTPVAASTSSGGGGTGSGS